MSEAFLVLSPNKKLRTFYHFLHHHRSSTVNLHQSVELCCQHLSATNVQRHTADITLMHRSHHFCHYRIATLVGKVQDLLLHLTDKLRHGRYSCTFKEFANHMWRQVTIVFTVFGVIRVFKVLRVLQAVYNPPDARHVNPVYIHLLVCRCRCFHHLCQCCCQRHLIGKVHMTFLQELLHLRSGRIHTRQDGEDRFLALQNFLVQHGIGIIQPHQTR